MDPFNHLPLPLIHLEGAAPQDTVISAAELSHYGVASDILFQARREAEALRLQAKNTLAEAKREADLIRQQARLQGQLEGERLIEATRTKAIVDTINWLVAECDMELVIASRLEEPIRNLVAQALLEFAGKQDPAELLVRRLARSVPEVLRNGQLQLRTHAWDIAAVQAILGDEVRVRVVADDALTPGQALLENDLVTLRIDLDTHLRLLLERLKDSQQSRREPREAIADASLSKPTPAQRSEPPLSASILTGADIN